MWLNCYSLECENHTFYLQLVSCVQEVDVEMRPASVMFRFDFVNCNVVYESDNYVHVLSITGSYITFRIMTFAWMTRWLFLNKDLIPLPFFTVGSIGLAVMTAMNIVLFYRLLKSDFFLAMPPTEMNKTDWFDIPTNVQYFVCIKIKLYEYLYVCLTPVGGKGRVVLFFILAKVIRTSSILVRGYNSYWVLICVICDQFS